MTCDVLAVGAHPDDVELGIGGTLAKLAMQGYSVILLDLTRARLSTRGDIVTREQEAAKAAEILGAKGRINLDLMEGSLLTDPNGLQKLVSTIRNLRPKLVLAPYFEDRHPDHGDASTLVQKAYFWAGVTKFGDDQPPFRPHRVAYYFCHREGPCSMVVDVSETFETKLASVRAYRSQFNLEEGETANTFLSRPEFIDRVVSRSKNYGMQIGVAYGEPLFVREMNSVPDLMKWTKDQGDVG